MPLFGSILPHGFGRIAAACLAGLGHIGLRLARLSRPARPPRLAWRFIRLGSGFCCCMLGPVYMPDRLAIALRLFGGLAAIRHLGRYALDHGLRRVGIDGLLMVGCRPILTLDTR